MQSSPLCSRKEAVPAQPPPSPDRSTHHSAFTLVELLIVIAVIAALFALALPTYNSSIRSSHEKAAQAHGAVVLLSLQTVLAANPQLTAPMLGPIDCTAAADVTPTGLVSSAGGTGWSNAPQGSQCQAAPSGERTFRITVTYDGQQEVNIP